MSEKVTPSHLARRAILYVRQSSPYQVSHNKESRLLQYGMQARLSELGWGEVEIFDGDLGRSAAGTTERKGFEDMLTLVCLGKVGYTVDSHASWNLPYPGLSGPDRNRRRPT